MIRSLNLDPMFVPVPYPETPYSLERFNGGEVHFKLGGGIDFAKTEKVIITHRITSSEHIMQILMAKEALQHKKIKSFDLVIPYIPYARQDRRCAEGEAFSMKVFADLINTQGFDHVVTVDAHSDVAPALINNCVNMDNHQYVQQALHKLGFGDTSDQRMILVVPDAGASKKSNKLFYETKDFLDIVQCDKVRDTHTGALSGFKVFADDLKGKNCIIVDDICDGGRTFVGMAEKLKEKGAGNIYLFVTHGIFSAGFDKLAEYFTGIACTNSFKDIEENDLIKQIKIQV